MKKIITLGMAAIFALSTMPAANAQTKTEGQVNGQVNDNEVKAVPFATITLLYQKDSSLVKGVLSEENGHYQFEDIADGEYIVAASMLGYVKTYSAPFTIDASHDLINLRPLNLKPNSQMLKGVSVTATKPFIQHELDKTVVNVENSIVSAGNTALEILKKSPGVVVDQNGNISLNGKNGVMIYIDGKPTYLSQQQVSSMLKTMSSNSISKIELMTQPSAKYDAAGNAGIINIITRKNKNIGFNGSLTAGFGQGIYSRESAGANLNYRNGKVNLYGNYNFSHGKGTNHNRITRNFYDGADNSLSSVFKQQSSMYFPYNNHDFKAGADYYLNSKNTLGVMMNGTINNGSDNINTNTIIKNANGAIQSTAPTYNTSRNKWTNYTYDVNYRSQFDTTGRELDVDAAYSKFNSSSLQQFHTDTYNSDGSLSKEPGLLNPNIRKGSLPSIIDIKTVKIDYTHPLKNNAKIEAGLKSSWVTSDNNVQYFYLDNDVWKYDSATNHFKYTENINAAYLNFSKEFKKGWSLQLGLRGEQTISKGHQFTNDSTVKRNYFQLFPTAFIRKSLDKNNTLSFSYARRVDRPDYQDLNPFRYYLDPYTYQEGNPFLQPQLTNSFELSHAYKGWLNTTLSFSKTNDVMQDVLKQIDSEKVTYQTKENLSTKENIGLSVSAGIPITKWWMSNNFVNVFYDHFKGQYLGGELDYAKTTFMFNTTNTFTLPKSYSLELSGYYHSGFVDGFLVGAPMGQISFGIQKRFMNQHATLKLNVNDVFNLMHFQGAVKYQNIDVSIVNHWDNRRASLTFTYNFSKGNVKPSRHHSSAIEEEQDRIKKGNN